MLRADIYRKYFEVGWVYLVGVKYMGTTYLKIGMSDEGEGIISGFANMNPDLEFTWHGSLPIPGAKSFLDEYHARRGKKKASLDIHEKVASNIYKLNVVEKVELVLLMLVYLTYIPITLLTIIFAVFELISSYV